MVEVRGCAAARYYMLSITVLSSVTDDSVCVWRYVWGVHSVV